MARFVTFSLLLGLALAAAPEARAAEPVGEKFPDADAPLGVLPTNPDAFVDRKMARTWGALPARPFIATTFDFGFVYVRPRISFGYGRPFTQWVGVDANVIAQGSGLGAYTGLRAEIPHVDWRLGSRFFSSFEHTYLVRKPSYQRIDLERELSKPARTLTFETELDLNFKLGPGALLLRGSASYVTGVPEGKDVFEETLHVIVTPPLVWRSRVAYVFLFGGHNQHSLGPAVDVLNVPSREDSLTVRVGPILRVQLSRRVDVRGSFVASVISPDRIGRPGGDFGELGLRYRWASE